MFQANKLCFWQKNWKNQEKKLPRTYENNELKTVGYKSWVSGFSWSVMVVCEK